MKKFTIIDISQPVDSKTACFPGDVAFSKQITLNYQENQTVNLTSMTMSPHVGTHVDAPAHITGDLFANVNTAGCLPLTPFLGEALVIDLSPFHDVITIPLIAEKLDLGKKLPPRILFKTVNELRYQIFEKQYAYFSLEVIKYLAEKSVVLMGIDTPSVDHIKSKDLKAHHALNTANIAWIENLDLTKVNTGIYTLIALPLKLTELEASPVRAVLLSPEIANL